MFGKGNCYDNSAVERSQISEDGNDLATELADTPSEAAIFQYIHGFDNCRRRLSYLGGISPPAFEAKGHNK